MRTLRTSLLVLAALAALHTAAWLGGDRMLDVTLAREATRLRAQGWQVAYGPPRHAGWPLAAELDVPDVRLRDPSGQFAWQSGRLRFELRATTPMLLRAWLDGPHLATIGTDPPIPVTAGDLSATAALTGPPRIDFTGRTIAAQLPAGPLTVARLDVHAALAPDGPTFAAHALELDAAGLFPALPAELAPRVARLDLIAQLNHNWPLDVRPRAAATAWRDGGGRLDLTRLHLQWNRLDLTLHATLGLDAGLQPEGSGVIDAAGIPATLDSLANARLIPQAPARAVETLLLLQRPGPGGAVSLPLTLSGRTVHLLGIPLLQLPEVAWP